MKVEFPRRIYDQFGMVTDVETWADCYDIATYAMDRYCGQGFQPGDVQALMLQCVHDAVLVAHARAAERKKVGLNLPPPPPYVHDWSFLDRHKPCATSSPFSTKVIGSITSGLNPE